MRGAGDLSRLLSSAVKAGRKFIAKPMNLEVLVACFEENTSAKP
jgi:hypothetical protein